MSGLVIRIALLGGLLVTLVAFAVAGAKPVPVLKKQWRRPVALALAQDHLWVANREGSLTLVQARTLEVLRERPLPGRPADLCLLPDGVHLVVSLEDRSEVVLFRHAGDDLREIARCAVPGGPRTLLPVPGADEKEWRLIVACRWGRALVDLSIRPGNEEALVRSAEGALGFCPDRLLLLEDAGRVVVADGFGGTIALVDLEGLEIVVTHAIPGHNIRGLALSADGKRLLLAHQHLSPLARTTRDDVHWGTLLGNVVREIAVSDLVAPGNGVLPSKVTPLGGVGNGAADPGTLRVTGSGQWLVALEGAASVALVDRDAMTETRFPVGAGPTDLVLSRDGRYAYTAVTLEDRIAVLDLSSTRDPAVRSLALGPTPPESQREAGERLFRSGELSHDGWMSCASCHPDGHTNGLLCDTLGDSSHGTPKRVLSLLGVADTPPYAWDGSMPSLADQIAKTLRSTMHAPRVEESTLSSLAAFLADLGPPPRGPGSRSDEAVRRGRALFEETGCTRCHAEPYLTTPAVHDVGLRDEKGLAEFNPPSLRGLHLRPRLFHDGRASSLRNALRSFGHPGTEGLSPGDIEDLAAFLESV